MRSPKAMPRFGDKLDGFLLEKQLRLRQASLVMRFFKQISDTGVIGSVMSGSQRYPEMGDMLVDDPCSVRLMGLGLDMSAEDVPLCLAAYSSGSQCSRSIVRSMRFS